LIDYLIHWLIGRLIGGWFICCLHADKSDSKLNTFSSSCLDWTVGPTTNYIDWLVVSLIYLTIEWFIDWLIISIIYLFIHSFILLIFFLLARLIIWFTNSFFVWFMHTEAAFRYLDSELVTSELKMSKHLPCKMIIHSLIFVHWFIYRLIISLINLFINWLTHSFVDFWFDSFKSARNNQRIN
jgi:hypothetical protein